MLGYVIPAIGESSAVATVFGVPTHWPILTRIVSQMDTNKSSLNTQFWLKPVEAMPVESVIICVLQLKAVYHDGVYRNPVESGRTSRLDVVSMQSPSCLHHWWTDNVIVSQSCCQYWRCAANNCLVPEGCRRQKTCLWQFNRILLFWNAFIHIVSVSSLIRFALEGISLCYFSVDQLARMKFCLFHMIPTICGYDYLCLFNWVQLIRVCSG